MSNIAKKMVVSFIVVLMVAVVVYGIFAVIFSFDIVPFVIGAVVGTGINIFNIWLLDRAVDKVADGNIDNKGYIQLQYLLRLVLTAAALMLAIAADSWVFGGEGWYTLWGVAAAVFMKPVVNYTMAWFVKK
jgi:hypothetical protein